MYYSHVYTVNSAKKPLRFSRKHVHQRRASVRTSLPPNVSETRGKRSLVTYNGAGAFMLGQPDG